MKLLDTMGKVARTSSALLGLAFGAAPSTTTACVGAEMLGAVLTLVSSYQIKDVVQAASAGGPQRALDAGLALAATGGLAMISYLIYARLLPRVIEATTVHLDGELVRLTARIPTLEYADRPVHADKISLIRGQSQQLAGGLQAVTLNVRLGVGLAGTFLILVGIDPWLALLPLLAIPRALAGRQARKLAVRAQEATAEPMRLRGHIFNQATSPVAGKELRIFGLGEELADRYRKITATTRHLHLRSNFEGALWSALGDMVFTLGCVAAIGWLVVQAVHGRVSAGGVVLAATLATSLILQMTFVLQMAQYFQAMMTTVERYLWLVEFSDAAARGAPTDTPAPAQLRRGIRIEGLSFAYPDRDKPVLSDVSLELPAGQVIALVGENGSGKSTLVKLLCGFYPPSAGEILIDDTPLATIDPVDWRRRIGGAFQDFTNFEVLLRESVGLGDLPALGDGGRVTQALGRAGAGDLAGLGEAGLDTMLGKAWGGVDLSGGQWQKLALGRALMRPDPLLAVFDEPAAALDASAEHDMFERFAAEARSGSSAHRVTLLVSHRFSTVRMADAIAVLDAGRIVEFGPHAALMAAGGKYAELFEMQASAYR